MDWLAQSSRGFVGKVAGLGFKLTSSCLQSGLCQRPGNKDCSQGPLASHHLHQNKTGSSPSEPFLRSLQFFSNSPPCLFMMRSSAQPTSPPHRADSRAGGAARLDGRSLSKPDLCKPRASRWPGVQAGLGRPQAPPRPVVQVEDARGGPAPTPSSEKQHRRVEGTRILKLPA